MIRNDWAAKNYNNLPGIIQSHVHCEQATPPNQGERVSAIRCSGQELWLGKNPRGGFRRSLLMRRRRFLTSVGIATIPLLAGCTSADPGVTGSPTPSETPSPIPTETPSPTKGVTVTTWPPRTPHPDATPAQEAFPDYDWSKLDDASPVATTTLEMKDFEFRPLVATFPPETELTIVNKDSASHTLTIPKLRFDEEIGSGGSITIPFNQAGTFDYVCEFHPPGMLGRLVITSETP